jgi:hypothetical protein
MDDMINSEAIESIHYTLRQAIYRIESYTNWDDDECDTCYAVGMQDALHYLKPLVLLVSDTLADAKHSEIKTRIITVSEKQLNLFEIE